MPINLDHVVLLSPHRFVSDRLSAQQIYRSHEEADTLPSSNSILVRGIYERFVDYEFSIEPDVINRCGGNVSDYWPLIPNAARLWQILESVDISKRKFIAAVTELQSARFITLQEKGVLLESIHRKMVAAVQAEEIERVLDRERGKAKYVITRGTVYLLQSPHGYKIGKALDAFGRTSYLSLKLPFDVLLKHTIKCADYTRAEQFFHERFADKRINGEWFALDDDDVKYILSVAEMDENCVPVA